MDINQLRALLQKDPKAAFSFSSPGSQYTEAPPPPPPLPTFDEFSEGQIMPGQGFMTASDGRRVTFGQKTQDAEFVKPQRPATARPIRVFGDNGRDLGVSIEDPEIDYTKGSVNIPGLGKGYYSKDNASAYISDPNGGMKKVLIGFNEDAYQSGLDRQLARDAKQAQIDATRESILSSQQQRNKRETPAAPAGFRWTPDGNLEAIPGGPQAEVMEKRKLENDDRQNARASLAESGRMTLTQIDDLLKHPGFSNAVGFGIPFMRLVPGTDTADFAARLDQIKGGAFLEAFKSLKGGGAITEIEGKKAEAAITRMSMAQSEKEFIAAAQEYKSVVGNALNRLGPGQAAPPAQSSGLKPGTMQDGYVYQGGDPGSPASWRKIGER